MSFKKGIIILSILLSFTGIHAQEFKIEKVTIEDLEQKSHSKDTSAVAAVLFQKGKTYFVFNYDKGYELITEVTTRIKIYKKEGYNWANFFITAYKSGSKKEKIDFSNAYTYNLVNGKIEKSRLKSEGEFKEEINEFSDRYKIVMPNVKEGSIIEFEYKFDSPFLSSINDWNFQLEIPVNYSEYTTHIPDRFQYNVHYKGMLMPKVEKDEVNKFFEGNYQEMVNQIGGAKSERGTYKIPYTEYINTYSVQNMEALKEEKFVNNIKNYTSTVIHELASIRDKNQLVENYATDWETVTKRIYENENFGLELNKTGYFEDDIKVLIAGLNTREEKVQAIYKYVKSRVKWNDYTSYTCIDGVKAAYKNKTGNVAEINLMLTAMLRFAGVNANPVLLSTRSNGIAFFPNRNAYNYVIAAVEVENDLVLLDATENFSSPNVLPLRDLNWQGRLIRKDGSSVDVDLMPKTLSRELTNMVITLNTDGSINGKLRRQMSDHLALSFRQNYGGVANDTYLEQLENRNDNIEISDYKRENEADLLKPLVESYSFKDTKNIEIIGDKMYISPLLFLSTSENPFKQEKREYPVDFGYPMQDRYNISIEIPEGYVVETMPAAVNMVTGGELGSFKYIIGSSGNKIQMSITTDINTPIILTEYYDVLKDFFQKMIEKQNEKIVLKKV